MLLAQEQLHMVAAGAATKTVFEALSLAAQIYEGGALIIDVSMSPLIQSTHIYTKLGQQLGEQMFNITHPNPLGQMIYPQALSEQEN